MMASSQGSKKTFADDYELPFEYKANSNSSQTMSDETYLIDLYILEGFYIHLLAPSKISERHPLFVST